MCTIFYSSGRVLARPLGRAGRRRLRQRPYRSQQAPDLMRTLHRVLTPPGTVLPLVCPKAAVGSLFKVGDSVRGTLPLL
jgi:hypothetical protein